MMNLLWRIALITNDNNDNHHHSYHDSDNHFYYNHHTIKYHNNNNDTDEGYLKSIELGAGGVVGNNRWDLIGQSMVNAFTIVFL